MLCVHVRVTGGERMGVTDMHSRDRKWSQLEGHEWNSPFNSEIRIPAQCESNHHNSTQGKAKEGPQYWY